MKRWTLAFAAALLLAAPGHAADKTANFTFGFDVASMTTTYCVTTGKNGDPYDDAGFQFSAPAFDISIAAGTVTDTGTNGSFAAVAVGDTFILNSRDGDRSNTPVVPQVDTWIVAKASDNSITVADTVATATYRAFNYKLLACGTTAEDGWIKVAEFDKASVQFSVYYEAGDLGGLDVVWQCRESTRGAAPVQIYPGPSSDCGFGTLNTNVCTFTTPGADAFTRQINLTNFFECRMGLAFRTSDAGVREDVHATLVGTVGLP
jgi:hypothetical protein